MNKHTPGPWEVIESFYPSMKEIKGPSFTIAAVIWATNLTEKDYKNRHADLHLIAAAPDLLEALENIADIVADEWGTHRPCVMRAYAAIAKARGEV